MSDAGYLQIYMRMLLPPLRAYELRGTGRFSGPPAQHKSSRTELVQQCHLIKDVAYENTTVHAGLSAKVGWVKKGVINALSPRARQTANASEKHVKNQLSSVSVWQQAYDGLAWMFSCCCCRPGRRQGQTIEHTHASLRFPCQNSWSRKLLIRLMFDSQERYSLRVPCQPHAKSCLGWIRPERRWCRSKSMPSRPSANLKRM